MLFTLKEFKAYATRVIRRKVVTWDDYWNVLDMSAFLVEGGESLGSTGARLVNLTYQKHLRTSIHSFQFVNALPQAQKRSRAFASHREIEERTHNRSAFQKFRAWGRRSFPLRRFNTTRDCFGYDSNEGLASITASRAGTRVPPALRPNSRNIQTGSFGFDLLCFVSLISLLGVYLVGQQHEHEIERLEKSQRPEASETRFNAAAARFPETLISTTNAAGSISE